jgi:hypothetical protein
VSNDALIDGMLLSWRSSGRHSRHNLIVWFATPHPKLVNKFLRELGYTPAEIVGASKFILEMCK